MKKVLVVAFAVLGICNAVAENAKTIVSKDGQSIKVAEKQSKGFPSPRTYTKFFGMMGNDSVFISKNGKYCLIKVSAKTGKEYAKWIKTE